MIGKMELKKKYIKWLKAPVYYHGKCRPRFYGTDFLEKFDEFDESTSKLNKFDGDIWFVSDHHFNHKNIITYSERPFRTTFVMENKLVELHNMVVKPEDVVIMVGDFAFAGSKEGKRILERLNGYKVFIIGNHDVYHNKFKDFGYDEVYVCKELIYDGVTFNITHYPMMEETEDLNIHGHVHVGKEIFVGDHHFNVNCEFINFTPIHIDNILKQVRSENEHESTGC